MSFSEINMSLEAHSNPQHLKIRSKSLDLSRPTTSQPQKDISLLASSAQDKGKGLASPDEIDPHNGRAIGEDGKPVPRTVELASVSTPEHPVLLGGGLNWSKASTSRGARAEDLAGMSPDKQVAWFVHGGIAEAFGPDGDRTLVPAIMNMLRNPKIGYLFRLSAVKTLGLPKYASTCAPEILQIALNLQEKDFFDMPVCIRGIWIIKICLRLCP